LSQGAQKLSSSSGIRARIFGRFIRGDNLKRKKMKKLVSFSILCFIANLTFAQRIDGTGNTIIADHQDVELMAPGPLGSEKSSPANIINVIPSPAASVGDIAFDGEYLWVEGYNEYELYQISPIDGAVIRSIPTTVQRPHGLTFDGTDLWLSDGDNKIIQRIDTANGTVLQSFPAPGISNTSYPGGLAWDGQDLWHNDMMATNINPNDSTFKINTSGQRLEAYHAHGTYAQGLTWDGQYLWSSDNGSDEIYKIDVSTFTVIDTIDAPGGDFPNGLAFDGQYLWVANNSSDSIYQIDFGIIPSGIGDLNSSLGQLSVYPNPSTGTFFLKWDQNNSAEDISVMVFDPVGKMILTKRLTGMNTTMVDLHEYGSGVFFYTLFNKKGRIGSGKLIKE